MQVIYVYDDEGTMALAKVTECKPAQDAAIDVVEAVDKRVRLLGLLSQRVPRAPSRTGAVKAAGEKPRR